MSGLYWLVAKPGMEVDLCMSDPGFDVDLYVDTQIPVLTGILFRLPSIPPRAKWQPLSKAQTLDGLIVYEVMRYVALDPSAGISQRDAAPVPRLEPTGFHSVADDALKLLGRSDAAPYADHQNRPALHRLPPCVVSEGPIR